MVYCVVKRHCTVCLREKVRIIISIPLSGSVNNIPVHIAFGTTQTTSDSQSFICFLWSALIIPDVPYIGVLIESNCDESIDIINFVIFLVGCINELFGVFRELYTMQF